jgi:GntR family transcriptional regulator
MRLEPKLNSFAARKHVAAQPKHKQVAAELIKRISNGEYEAGQFLPSEPELTAEFSVSRHTIRMALRALYEKGLILTQQGRGSVVQPTATSPRYTFACDSISDITQYAAATARRAISTERINVGVRLAEWIGCKPNTFWWKVEHSRYRESRGDIIALSSAYVPDVFGAAVREFNVSDTALFKLVESMYDHTIAQVRQKFSVVSASEAEARYLGIEAASTVMCVERRFFDESGSLLEVTRTINPQDSFEYELTINQVMGQAPA